MTALYVIGILAAAVYIIVAIARAAVAVIIYHDDFMEKYHDQAIYELRTAPIWPILAIRAFVDTWHGREPRKNTTRRRHTPP